jgi:predicted site-specific integrase-resolvase
VIPVTIFLTQKQVMERLNITRTTILRWEEKGILNPIRLESGHRRYKQSDIENIIGEINVPIENKMNCVIYARVSTKKQKDNGNLDRQVKRLMEYAEQKNYHIVQIYQEVASGINENRRELHRMLKKVEEDDITIVLSEYKDRIARFGYEYLERYCHSHKTTIEFMEQQENQTLNEEMVEDMISIITSFSARLYGRRGAKHIKKEIEKIKRLN